MIDKCIIYHTKNRTSMGSKAPTCEGHSLYLCDNVILRVLTHSYLLVAVYPCLHDDHAGNKLHKTCHVLVFTVIVRIIFYVLYSSIARLANPH